MGRKNEFRKTIDYSYLEEKNTKEQKILFLHFVVNFA